LGVQIPHFLESSIISTAPTLLGSFCLYISGFD
jgi:hypothetical protein